MRDSILGAIEPRRQTVADALPAELIDRVRAAWPWLAEYAPALFEAIGKAEAAFEETGDPGPLRQAFEQAALAAEGTVPARVYSKLLDAEIWIAPDTETADELARDLAGSGDHRVVLSAREASALGTMLEADSRALLQKMALVAAVMPSARVRLVGREEAFFDA